MGRRRTDRTAPRWGRRRAESSGPLTKMCRCRSFRLLVQCAVTTLAITPEDVLIQCYRTGSHSPYKKGSSRDRSTDFQTHHFELIHKRVLAASSVLTSITPPRTQLTSALGQGFGLLPARPQPAPSGGCHWRTEGSCCACTRRASSGGVQRDGRRPSARAH